MLLRSGHPVRRPPGLRREQSGVLSLPISDQGGPTLGIGRYCPDASVRACLPDDAVRLSYIEKANLCRPVVCRAQSKHASQPDQPGGSPNEQDAPVKGVSTHAPDAAFLAARGWCPGDGNGSRHRHRYIVTSESLHPPSSSICKHCDLIFWVELTRTTLTPDRLNHFLGLEVVNVSHSPSFSADR
jgi:hypothetical protein